MYHQMDKWVVSGRSARVQGDVPWLLTQQYACCVLYFGLQGGREGAILSLLCLVVDEFNALYNEVDGNTRNLVRTRSE